jgi:hypothetical protein
MGESNRDSIDKLYDRTARCAAWGFEPKSFDDCPVVDSAACPHTCGLFGKSISRAQCNRRANSQETPGNKSRAG